MQYRMRQIYQLTDNKADGWTSWRDLPPDLTISNEWGYTQLEFRPDEHQWAAYQDKMTDLADQMHENSQEAGR